MKTGHRPAVSFPTSLIDSCAFGHAILFGNRSRGRPCTFRTPYLQEVQVAPFLTTKYAKYLSDHLALQVCHDAKMEKGRNHRFMAEGFNSAIVEFNSSAGVIPLGVFICVICVTFAVFACFC